MNKLTARKHVSVLAEIFAAAVPILAGVMNVWAQSSTAVKPAFEVASIKPVAPPAPGAPRPAACGGPSTPGHLTVCTNVMSLLRNAYTFYAGGRRNPSAVPALVEGGPGWMASDLYAVNAKAEGNASLEMMQGPMMQALLEDRFKLKFHREIRQVPVYELTVAKNDSKLRQHEETGCTPPDPSKPAAAAPEPGQKPACKGSSISRNGANFTAAWAGGTLDLLSSGLYGIGASESRPIVNKTGIAGIFTFRLEFAALDAGGGAPTGAQPAADDLALPSIFTVLEEQLGLKLVPAKGPQEFLIVDDVERPSEN